MLFTLLIPHINAETAPYVRTISDAILVEPMPNQSFDVDLHGNPDRSYYGTMRCDDVTMPISGNMASGYESYAPTAATSYAAPAAASYPPMATYAPASGSYYQPERLYAESMPVAPPFIIADQGMSSAVMQGQGQGQGQAGAATGGAAAGTGMSEGGTGKSSGLKDEKSGDKKGTSKSSSKKSSKSSSKTKSSNGAASISIMSALLGVALCVILV